MPIYDYHCDHCGHTFSQVQSYTDATLETCPSCGKRPRKLMATPAIVFKGGGWYKTDSRAKPTETGTDTAATTKDAPAAAAGATEAKPAAEKKAATPAPAAPKEAASS